MGKHRRPREAQEAETLRKKGRTRCLSAFFLVLAAAAAGFWFLSLREKGPQDENERLIRLAAERGWFVFGMHIDAEDFARIEPHLEEAFREAKAQGRKVILVQELGSLGIPLDETGVRPSAGNWLARIAQDPRRWEDWYRREIVNDGGMGEPLKRGEYCAPNYYTDNPSGSFFKALHACLLRHRDLLEDVVQENLGWEDYEASVRMYDLDDRAAEAFRQGDPNGSERSAREKARLGDASNASRDRRLLLQMGRLMDRGDDLVAVTVRGAGHWRMVERHSLRNARRDDWAALLARSYGADKVQLHGLMGSPVEPGEERRAFLACAPSSILAAHFLNTGRSRDNREVILRTRSVFENPDLTADRLRELSFDLGRARREKGLDEAGACPFVHDWLEAKGLLRPDQSR